MEITRVRLQLARNENHAARHGIDKLLEITPRHPEVLRLAEQAYTRTGARGGRCWTSFRRWRKLTSAMKRTVRRWEQLAWVGLMDKALGRWRQRRTTRMVAQPEP